MTKKFKTYNRNVNFYNYCSDRETVNLKPHHRVPEEACWLRQLRCRPAGCWPPCSGGRSPTAQPRTRPGTPGRGPAGPAPGTLTSSRAAHHLNSLRICQSLYNVKPKAQSERCAPTCAFGHWVPLFNDDLSNEPNFSRIHLAGQYL